MDQPMMSDQQQVVSGAQEGQQAIPVPSTDKFMDIIDQTDFMVDNDGAYDDCEMLAADAELTSF